MNDVQGRLLLPYHNLDLMRHKPVWAVYKVAGERLVAECQSDVADLATAKAKVDAYKADRPEGYYFRIFRLAASDEKAADANQRPTRWR